MRNSRENFERAALYSRFNAMSMKFYSELSLIDIDLLNGEDDAHRVGAAVE